MEDYDVFGRSGPNDVAELIEELEPKGVRPREAKEMGDPLGDLFGS